MDAARRPLEPPGSDVPNDVSNSRAVGDSSPPMLLCLLPLEPELLFSLLLLHLCANDRKEELSTRCASGS